MMTPTPSKPAKWWARVPDKPAGEALKACPACTRPERPRIYVTNAICSCTYCGWRAEIPQLGNTRAPPPSALDDEVVAVLHSLDQWEQAYPLDAFPEPDFKKAAALLKAGGMTLDAVSASNMRHVVSCIVPEVRALLARLKDRGTD